LGSEDNSAVGQLSSDNWAMNANFQKSNFRVEQYNGIIKDETIKEIISGIKFRRISSEASIKNIANKLGVGKVTSKSFSLSYAYCLKPTTLAYGCVTRVLY
jgi:hypothetical protein